MRTSCPRYLLRSALLTRKRGTGNALQAAAAGGHSDIINLLLENKPPAVVGTPGGHYGSALMAAVCSGSKDAVSALLEEEANPSVRDRVYGTPLEKAASMGRAGKDVVELLVEYEAKADLSPTSDGYHILHQAAMFGMDELVNYCLDKGCQIDMVTTKKPEYNWKARFNWFPREMTPLAFACAEGHTVVVRTLLKRGAPFEEDRPNSAPLWAAAYQGHADVINLLVTEFRKKHSEEDTIGFMDHLPDPDAGRHFILYAAASSGRADAVQILLDHRAPYRSNWFGATPLHATASFGCADVTKLLLDYHKDKRVDACLDQRTQNGRTALYEACAGNQADIAAQLLDAGADLLVSNDKNRTTLQAACCHENHKLVEKLVNKASERGDSQQFLEFLNTRHGPTGNTALMECAARNILSSLILLLDRGADPLVRNNEKITALHLACRQGNLSLVKRLIDKAREVTDQSGFLKFINQQPSSHMTALIECAANNNVQALNLLLEHKADYTLHGHFGNTPLLWASGKGYYNIVAALVKQAKLDNGEPCSFKDFLNHKSRDNNNALFSAAKGNHQPIVKILLDEGIDWSVTNKAGVSALHAASWEGHTEVVSDLLAKVHETASPEDFKKLLNGRNEYGKTAALDAVEKGRTETIKELLEKYEADFLITNNDDCSALHAACWKGHTEAVSFVLQFASTKLSRERFLQFLNHRNKWGKTAFMDAAERGRLEIIQMLREQQYGADYRIPNNNDVTPLHISSWVGHKEVAAFILKTASQDLSAERFQTFINHRNKWGKTVLMDAAERNRSDMINLLLDHSADYTIRDNAGFTALHYCAFRNHTPALRTLLDRTCPRPQITHHPDPDSDPESRMKKFARFLNQQSDTNRATALRDAASQRHTDLAKLLLRYHPAYDLTDSKRRTAMHHAVERSDGPLGMALLEYAGRDDDRARFRRFVNARDENGVSVWDGVRRKGGMPRFAEKLKACGVVEGL